MEFQEGMMRLTIHKPIEKKQWVKKKSTEKKSTEKKGTEKEETPRRKWKIFQRSSSNSAVSSKGESRKKEPPWEFLCPITGDLMADPVIVSSGHTFERACVDACKALNFTPTLTDASTADFSTVIPNLALKSTIAAWCRSSFTDLPKPLDSTSAEKLVRTFMASRGQKPATESDKKEEEEERVIVITEKELLQRLRASPTVNLSAEIARRRIHIYSSSEESVGPTTSEAQTQTQTQTPTPTPPSLPPSTGSNSSSSSSEIEAHNPSSSSSEEEDELVTSLRSHQVFEVEDALITLRKMTRSKEETRAHLCSYQLLATLRSLISSRYTVIQVNSVAVLVNLSLEKSNKMKILRSGIVPPLIDVLKCGSLEAQEHAAGAIFSLALDEDNKTAIGVLGALEPLLHLLRARRARTRHDSAVALYHLTLVQTNRYKLVKLGAVPVLLNMVRTGHMTSWVLLILCNLGSCVDGRVALLDVGAVECLVGILSGTELVTQSTWENCVSLLYVLSHGGLRFKALAKEAGLVEVLIKVEAAGTEKARQKARAVIDVMKRKEEEEEVDWEKLLNEESETQPQLGDGLGGSSANSS